MSQGGSVRAAAESRRHTIGGGIIPTGRYLPFEMIVPRQSSKRRPSARWILCTRVPESAIYIPVELGGRRGRAVFIAVHRDPGATLHWHLDDRYVGSTSMFHEQALDMGLGWHTLTVVDERGNSARRRFEVLSKGVASGAVSEVVQRPP